MNQPTNAKRYKKTAQDNPKIKKKEKRKENAGQDLATVITGCGPHDILTSLNVSVVKGKYF